MLVKIELYDGHVPATCVEETCCTLLSKYGAERENRHLFVLPPMFWTALQAELDRTFGKPRSMGRYKTYMKDNVAIDMMPFGRVRVTAKDVGANSYTIVKLETACKDVLLMGTHEGECTFVGEETNAVCPSCSTPKGVCWEHQSAFSLRKDVMTQTLNAYVQQNRSY